MITKEQYLALHGLKEDMVNASNEFMHKDYWFKLYDLADTQGSEDFYVCVTCCAEPDDCCYLHAVQNACSYGSYYDLRPDTEVASHILEAIDKWLQSEDTKVHVPATFKQIQHFYSDDWEPNSSLK